jgi:dual-specificity kinase
MPETRRKAKGLEPVPPESLASSRPLTAKRRRPSTRAAPEHAPSSVPGPLAAPQRTHSNVGSSQQPDTRTDSSEVLAPLAARTRPPPAPRGLPLRPIPIPSPIIPEPELPPAKRARIPRATIPPPLPRDALRVTDRFSGPFNADTDEGHYNFSIGDNLTPRFKIMRKFGEGTFGRVMECWDRRRAGYVAIKVIRAVDKYRDAAMVELQVLTTLAANDPTERYPIVRLLEWFDYRGHVCMVFDRLGPSIYDCLRRNAYRPFPLVMARSFLMQVLEAVSYMHGFSLVHTDLKPENILFLDEEVVTVNAPSGSKLARKLPPRPAVRLIDFGSATFDEDYHSSIVSTRHYRAPEIILGLGWSRPCDMWSLGCILVELLTGDALFQTHENLEHLAMMEAVLGPMPTTISRRACEQGAPAVRELFKRGQHRLNWPEGAEGKRSLRAVSKLAPLRDHFVANADSSISPYLDVAVDLCKRLMEWDPSRRITAEEALRHPFFALELPKSNVA